MLAGRAPSAGPRLPRRAPRGQSDSDWRGRCVVY